MNLLILGYIRPELDYVTKELLIEDINKDIEVAKKSLDRPTYLEWKKDPFLVEKTSKDQGKSGILEGDPGPAPVPKV
jgi:riboflavin kinase